MCEGIGALSPNNLGAKVSISTIPVPLSLAYRHRGPLHYILPLSLPLSLFFSLLCALDSAFSYTCYQLQKLQPTLIYPYI